MHLFHKWNKAEPGFYWMGDDGFYALVNCKKCPATKVIRQWSRIKQWRYKLINRSLDFMLGRWLFMWTWRIKNMICGR